MKKPATDTPPASAPEGNKAFTVVVPDRIYRLFRSHCALDGILPPQRVRQFVEQFVEQREQGSR